MDKNNYGGKYLQSLDLQFDMKSIGSIHSLSKFFCVFPSGNLLLFVEGLLTRDFYHTLRVGILNSLHAIGKTAAHLVTSRSLNFFRQTKPR